MKNKLAQLKKHPTYDKAMHWGKLISITGGAQIIVQALGFICGILIIRLLPVQEYALYTLANTMLGTMTVLADGGISAGVMAQGGKVWQDKEKLGVVLATGLDLRKKFAIGSLLVSVPILFYLLLHNNASWLTAILITASLIPAFYAALSDSLLEIVPKLHQEIPLLQRNQINVGIGRLVLISLTIFIFPFTFLLLLVNGFTRFYGNIKLQNIVTPFIEKSQKPDPVIRKEILAIVKRVMPTSIYYAFSSQITVWMISIFGNTTSLAELGALGRFAIVFTFAGVLLETLLVPRFSRIVDNTKLVISRFIQLQVLLFIISILFVFLFKIFDNQLLWVLGKSYKGLNKELLLIAISGCVTLLSSSTNRLLSVRGIIIPPILFISITLSVQIITLFFVPMDTVYGVIMYGVYSTLSLYLIRIIYFSIYIKKMLT